MVAQLYDTHAHLDDSRLLTDIDTVLAEAKEAGVIRINNVGCSWESSLRSVELAEKYPQQIRAIIGVHPSDAHQIHAEMLQKLVELAEHPLVVGWGEIGLDYHYDDAPTKEVQAYAFRQQIDAAKALHLPIIIHERDAHQDTINILREMKAGVNGGIIHCFSGSWEMAKECMTMGFHIALGGPVTYLNAKTPVEVASKIPLDYLLTETDCPYLSPHPYRGKLNKPSRVAVTAARLAEIRQMDYEDMCAILTKNAFALFAKENYDRNTNETINAQPNG